MKVSNIDNQINENKISHNGVFQKYSIAPIQYDKKKPRTLRISIDDERKQKDIDAKCFIKRLNKGKIERLVKEETKRKLFEERLMEMVSNAENTLKMSKAIKEINHSTGNNQRNNHNHNNIHNIKSNETNKIKKGSNKFKSSLSSEIKLPVINIKPKVIQVKKDPQELSSIKDLTENSVSFKINKNSPYYFNNPSKVTEFQKIKGKKQFLNPDVNFFTDGGGNSLEEYEIL
jgi:hypothetical protein